MPQNYNMVLKGELKKNPPKKLSGDFKIAFLK